MNDFDRRPGSVDDPGLRGGTDPEQRPLPPGDTAGDTGGPDEPRPAELDMPEAGDPVAWSYVERGTNVVGREGIRIGTVEQMLGTEAENIFHGVALRAAGGGPTRFIPADRVTSLTPARVEVQVAVDEVEALEEYQPPG